MRRIKNKINITLDCDLLEVLREMAEQDDRSLSSYINIILRQYVNDRDLWKILEGHTRPRQKSGECVQGIDDA